MHQQSPRHLGQISPLQHLVSRKGFRASTLVDLKLLDDGRGFEEVNLNGSTVSQRNRITAAVSQVGDVTPSEGRLFEQLTKRGFSRLLAVFDPAAEERQLSRIRRRLVISSLKHELPRSGDPEHGQRDGHVGHCTRVASP
jgi:hypothetical protein